MNVDSLTRAFIRGAALAVTLSACGETAPTQPKYEPVPSDFPSCVGPDYGTDGEGYYGQCCADVRCIQTEAGVCPQSPPYAILPPGSGECECAENLGPFAPRSETDDCCYVVYEIACDGRPLKRDGAVVVAEVVARPDWMGAAKLPVWS
jgi:hypothetical protein